jgi:23S rRNA (cytidine1920-2'-O)/16S rRNA (cytidine1409-2'-O)-methyltransferase
MDVSFISATLVLPAVVAAAFPESPQEREGRKIIVLVKPQFEAGREFIGKGGIVHNESAQTAAVEKVRATLTRLRVAETDVIESPIRGVGGNREFLLYGRF